MQSTVLQNMRNILFPQFHSCWSSLALKHEINVKTGQTVCGCRKSNRYATFWDVVNRSDLVAMVIYTMLPGRSKQTNKQTEEEACIRFRSFYLKPLLHQHDCNQIKCAALPQDDKNQQDVDDAEAGCEQRRSRVHVKLQVNDVQAEAVLANKRQTCLKSYKHAPSF